MSVGLHGLALGSRRVFPNEFAISPLNGAGTFTIPAPHGTKSVVISGFEWSYDGLPVGRIRIVDDQGFEYVNFDVTASGPGFQDYDPPLRFVGGRAISLIIDPGGIGVTGKIRPKARWIE